MAGERGKGGVMLHERYGDLLLFQILKVTVELTLLFLKRSAVSGLISELVGELLL